MKDFYWPLGGLDYGHEVRDLFPQEAELLGVIAIMWNRQEGALRRLFLEILAPRSHSYGEAIWDRQPTHHARRDLLALARETAGLTDRQRGVLDWVIEKTKTLADRRNELIHAEFVVHSRTDVLHAKIKSPRSSKPPKHQKASPNDLEKIVNDLNVLLQATEASWVEFLAPEKKLQWDNLLKASEPGNPSPRNQSD
ncbi:hypothetical protein [Sphingobium sp. B2D3C]|uniref:hypothetical protein n=1 Tax=Sphingobium sp. B2D3C TaxID=2940581 RepID=UPI0022257E56|nr:hypothetical protein [Sphingobium sp. B2D3C]MCW2381354.1 hypothetical protein [Sphingobium sp. B2D3B]MCW2398539.1 hypothetical protein [Sphingobium sp. B2D3C]